MPCGDKYFSIWKLQSLNIFLSSIFLIWGDIQKIFLSMEMMCIWFFWLYMSWQLENASFSVCQTYYYFDNNQFHLFFNLLITSIICNYTSCGLSTLVDLSFGNNAPIECSSFSIHSQLVFYSSIFLVFRDTLCSVINGIKNFMNLHNLFPFGLRF